jgi:hypothetical protein
MGPDPGMGKNPDPLFRKPLGLQGRKPDGYTVRSFQKVF